jgi:serine/threonine-protein kinase
MLSASGITVKKYVLTSWSVKCVDNYTGEEIYFNNKVPQKQSWPDEDVAIQEIGRMIGSEFSKEFFEEHLQQSTQIYQLQVIGLPSYDVGEMLKKEFIGLRPVINVDFRSFDESGLSLYEVEFSGKRSNFNKIVNDTIVKPLNVKLGANCFKLASAQANVVKLNFQPAQDLVPEVLASRFEKNPPASIVDAGPARLKDVVKTPEMIQRVEAVNPSINKQQSKDGIMGAEEARDITKGF